MSDLRCISWCYRSVGACFLCALAANSMLNSCRSFWAVGVSDDGAGHSWKTSPGGPLGAGCRGSPGAQQSLCNHFLPRGWPGQEVAAGSPGWNRATGRRWSAQGARVGWGSHVREPDARTPSLGAGSSPGLPPTLVALNEGGEPPRAEPDRRMATQRGHEVSVLDTCFLPELCRQTA